MNIKLDSVTKVFLENGAKQEILKDVSYNFESAKTYAITGVSGVGKSTLMHLLSGIDVPTSGKIYFGDSDINKFSRQEKELFFNKRIGLVFQEPCLIPELSVLENVMIKGMIAAPDSYFDTSCSAKASQATQYDRPFISSIRRSIYAKADVSRDDLKERALSLLKMVGLENKSNSNPLKLSGGQQQRIAILRAIFNRPDFILADEPTGNLDEKSAKDVIDLLLKYHSELNIGLIISSHDPEVYNSMKTVLRLVDHKLF